MYVDLSPYARKTICVAVSGGRDSMALLHYIYNAKDSHSITLLALNCEHGIRGNSSLSDSLFVKNWCEEHNVPLLSFSANCIELAKTEKCSVETAARNWRRQCYAIAIERGADYIALAHHKNDVAETVLFNLLRGSASGGVSGIKATSYSLNGTSVPIIRPLIDCDRTQIDDYIKNNTIPYVQDETNDDLAYTRNYIRKQIIPLLQEVFPKAVDSICRFANSQNDDERYFNEQIAPLISFNEGIAYVRFSPYPSLFNRAIVKVIKEFFNKKDYTTTQLNTLFELRSAQNGKRYEFLNLVAIKEGDRLSLFERRIQNTNTVLYKEYDQTQFDGEYLAFNHLLPKDGEYKALRFDDDKIPASAIIRHRREGDFIVKFGGGTKSLSDYFTDKKIPQSVRDLIPLIADGNKIYIVCGVDISNDVRIDDNTQKQSYVISKNYILL